MTNFCLSFDCSNIIGHSQEKENWLDLIFDMLILEASGNELMEVKETLTKKLKVICGSSLRESTSAGHILRKRLMFQSI